jgi:hypothetical protein
MSGIDFKQKIRFVEYYFPSQGRKTDFQFYCKSLVPLKDNKTTIYETIEIYEKTLFHHIQTRKVRISPEQIPLRSLINIHNQDGIKDIHQIKRFTAKIKKGEDIVNPSGLPNIKLARLRSKDLLVFDGHHSLLSYMAAGRIFLDEIPHLIVSGNRGVLKDNDITVFWGQHAAKITPKKWKNFTINWQNPLNKQLCLRKQRDMGELFDALGEKI